MTSLLFFLFLLTACGDTGTVAPQQYAGRVMGTTYHVSIVARETDAVRNNVSEEIQAQLDAVDRRMSTYKSDSELSRLNDNQSGDWIDLSADLYRVLKQAQQVSERSDGAFDVTVAPLVDLWGFGPARQNDGVLPADVDIERVLQQIGYRNLQLRSQPFAAKKIAAIRIDLSAIAKGFAADRLGEFLASRGYTDYLIEIGGDLLVSGRNAEGIPWRIGVEQPSFDYSGVQQTLNVSDVGVATSGDYRNYFERDGVRYPHTLDPASGRPISHNLASATVVAESAALADAWATAFTVMGYEKGIKYATAHNIAAYFIIKTADGFRTEASPAMTPYLQAEGSRQ